jgi:hypothetical protein
MTRLKSDTKKTSKERAEKPAAQKTKSSATNLPVIRLFLGLSVFNHLHLRLTNRLLRIAFPRGCKVLSIEAVVATTPSFACRYCAAASAAFILGSLAGDYPKDCHQKPGGPARSNLETFIVRSRPFAFRSSAFAVMFQSPRQLS